MQKIRTIYIRDEANPKRVTDEIDPDCQWVFDGEGKATEKFDGSACLVRDGLLYRRLHLRPGKDKPPGWIHWSFNDPSPTGHGWLPVTGCKSDAYHREAWASRAQFKDGTYEVVGPKSNGNPHQLLEHTLWQHGLVTYADMPDKPVDGCQLEEWFVDHPPMEGIVWHHPDGRMAKIKAKDFGLRWPCIKHRGE